MKANPDLDNTDMTAGYNHSILIPGEGESGRLIGWYQYFSMRESKGWSEQGQALYNKKIWDDRGQAFKAPTVKTVAMTGVGIAATLMSGGASGPMVGALISASATIGTDALFTMADVAHGADANDAWGGFGKRALTTGVTSTISLATAGLGNGLVGALGATGNSFATAGIQAVSAGAISATNRLASTAINSIGYGSNGFTFDGNSFGQAWDTNNLSNYSSIASSMVGAGVSSYVNSGGLGFLGEKLKDYNKVGDMAGSLASQGVNYAMTGEATFNLANLSMFGLKDAGMKNTASMGLLEMHLGGSDGLSMNLGSGGADMSYQAWQGVAQGLSVWDENKKINATTQSWLQSGKVDQDLSVAMRSLASQEHGSADLELYNQLMNGTSSIRSDSSLNAVAKTELNDQGGRTITLGGNKIGNGGVFDNSVLLAHEAVRDGVWNGEAGQIDETRGAALNHMDMAMQINGTYSGGLSGNLAADGRVYAAYKDGLISGGAMNDYIDSTYSSKADYWKVRVADGKIFADWDGTRDVTLPDGTKIAAEKEGAVSGKYLSKALFGGDKNSGAIGDLLSLSGLNWSDKSNSWNTSDGSAFGPTGELSLDITEIVDGASGYGKQFGEWMRGGMKDVALADIGGLPDGTFGYVNTGRLLADAAIQIAGLPGTPNEKLSALREINTGSMSQIGATSLADTGAFAVQYNRLFSSFVGHIGNTVLPGGANGTSGGDAIEAYDGAQVLKDSSGRWVHGGGDINVNFQVPYAAKKPDGSVWDFDNGMAITAPFSGRTVTENALGLVSRDSSNPGRLVYESGFTFGNRFISTGLYGAISHANISVPYSLFDGKTRNFTSDTVLGTVSHLGATNNHLHQELMSNPQNNKAAWFENLFNNTVVAKQFSRADLYNASGVSLNRRYYNIDTIWNNYWRPGR